MLIDETSRHKMLTKEWNSEKDKIVIFYKMLPDLFQASLRLVNQK